MTSIVKDCVFNPTGQSPKRYGTTVNGSVYEFTESVDIGDGLSGIEIPQYQEDAPAIRYIDFEQVQKGCTTKSNDNRLTIMAEGSYRVSFQGQTLSTPQLNPIQYVVICVTFVKSSTGNEPEVKRNYFAQDTIPTDEQDSQLTNITAQVHFNFKKGDTLSIGLYYLRFYGGDAGNMYLLSMPSFANITLPSLNNLGQIGSTSKNQPILFIDKLITDECTIITPNNSIPRNVDTSSLELLSPQRVVTPSNITSNIIGTYLQFNLLSGSCIDVVTETQGTSTYTKITAKKDGIYNFDFKPTFVAGGENVQSVASSVYTLGVIFYINGQEMNVWQESTSTIFDPDRLSIIDTLNAKRSFRLKQGDGVVIGVYALTSLLPAFFCNILNTSNVDPDFGLIDSIIPYNGSNLTNCNYTSTLFVSRQNDTDYDCDTGTRQKRMDAEDMTFSVPITSPYLLPIKKFSTLSINDPTLINFAKRCYLNAKNIDKITIVEKGVYDMKFSGCFQTFIGTLETTGTLDIGVGIIINRSSIASLTFGSMYDLAFSTANSESFQATKIIEVNKSAKLKKGDIVEVFAFALEFGEIQSESYLLSNEVDDASINSIFPPGSTTPEDTIIPSLKPYFNVYKIEECETIGTCYSECDIINILENQ